MSSLPDTRQQSFDEIYGPPENFLEIEVCCWVLWLGSIARLSHAPSLPPGSCDQWPNPSSSPRCFMNKNKMDTHN